MTWLDEKTFDAIEDICEGLDWRVMQSARNEAEVDLEFETWSPEGQDFIVPLVVKRDGTDVVSQLEEFIDRFDPDEEAMLWLGPDGHGMNGAPYHMADVVADMEECLQLAKDLSEQLSLNLRGRSIGLSDALSPTASEALAADEGHTGHSDPDPR